MKMWLLGSADPSADINSLSHLRDSETGDVHRLVRFPKGTAVARWRAYMESYVLSSPTELVDEQLKGRLRRTFLARYVRFKTFIYPSVLLITSSLMFYSHRFFLVRDVSLFLLRFLHLVVSACGRSGMHAACRLDRWLSIGICP